MTARIVVDRVMAGAMLVVLGNGLWICGKCFVRNNPSIAKFFSG
jgi:hypothetical protein